MQWRNLFTTVKSMSAAEAKHYIDSHPAGDYQLVDVRQPAEYEKAHLPGAIFMPLATLPDRVHELTKDIPTIAYCAVGGRIRAASQYLAGQGFTDVYNMAGGIKAWQGVRTTGPEERGKYYCMAGSVGICCIDGDQNRIPCGPYVCHFIAYVKATDFCGQGVVSLKISE